MVCDISYNANGHNWLCPFLSNFELQAIVVVYADGVIAIVKCLGCKDKHYF